MLSLLWSRALICGTRGASSPSATRSANEGRANLGASSALCQLVADSVEEVREPNEAGLAFKVASFFRPAAGSGLVSIWPASGGSGQLLRGGTRHGHHLVLLIAVDPV
jgi:hypothetical protein